MRSCLAAVPPLMKRSAPATGWVGRSAHFRYSAYRLARSLATWSRSFCLSSPTRRNDAPRPSGWAVCAARAAAALAVAAGLRGFDFLAGLLEARTLDRDFLA